MPEEVSLAADPRRDLGTRPARRVRRDGRVPGVLYGHGTDPISLTVDGRALRGALTTGAGANALITLNLDGDRHLAMARQLQRHPVRGNVEHVDFVIVRRDEVVSADVPIHLVGEAEEVHKGDGLVDQVLFSLAINAKPADIPSAIEVDVSEMVIGDNIRVGDLKLATGVTIDVDPDETVVSARGPQAMEVPEEAPETADEAAEGGEEAGEPAGEAPAEPEQSGEQSEG